MSIRKDVDTGVFEFPEPYELKLRLKDLLEDEVDEKYYLSESMTNYILDTNSVQEGTKWEGCADKGILNPDIALTLGCRSAGGHQRAGVCNFIVDGLDEEITVGEFKGLLNSGKCSVIVKTNNSKGYSVPVYEEQETTEESVSLRIRKLTPKECFRLQGFDDSDVDLLVANGVSDTQLYKQAGNSITVDVLEELFCMLFDEEGNLYL